MPGLGAVGVVIVTYNSADTISEALRCLPLAQLAGVVVVDNASTDGTADIVDELGLDNVRVHRSATNGGFGAGCNLGVHELPEAEWLLLLNPDARIDPPDLERLLAHVSGRPSALLVAPRLRQD